MFALAHREIKLPVKGEAPLQGDELHAFRDQLGDGWQVNNEDHLEKTFKFTDFQEALNFTNAVGELAEEVNHHPEICLSWGKAKITLWTHSIGGLSEADFIFAAKCDQLT